ANYLLLYKMGLDERRYIIASFHREENVDNKNNFENFIDSLNRLADEYKVPIILSTHPRTLKRLKENTIEINNEIQIVKPLGYFDYMELQINSLLSVFDSGTITEESSILGFPAINLREAHERPEGMEEGAVIMTGLSKDRVLEGLRILAEEKNDVKTPADYTVSNFSDKVLRIILSHIDHVNIFTWHKS